VGGRLTIDQRQFDRIADAVVSALFGIMAGVIVAWLDVGIYTVIVVTALWTAHIAYQMRLNKCD